MKIKIDGKTYKTKHIAIQLTLEPDSEIVRYLRSTSLKKELIEIEFDGPVKAFISGMVTELDGYRIGKTTTVKFTSVKEWVKNGK